MLVFKQSEDVAARRNWMFQLPGLAVGNETPSGTKNGVNTDFTLAQIPNPDSLLLTLNGQVQTGGGVDYTISGLIITFNSAPISSDTIVAAYDIPALTGQTGTGYITKNGATPVATTNSMVEVDATNMPGFYYIEFTASELDTLGFIGLRVKTAASEEFQDKALVSYNDPYLSAGGFSGGMSGSKGFTVKQANDIARRVWEYVLKDKMKAQDALIKAAEDIEFPEVSMIDYSKQLKEIRAAIKETDLTPVLKIVKDFPKPRDYSKDLVDIVSKLADMEKTTRLDVGGFAKTVGEFQAKMNLATKEINSSLKEVAMIKEGFGKLQQLMDEFQTTLADQGDMDKRFNAMSAVAGNKKLEELASQIQQMMIMLTDHKFEILKELSK